MVSCLQTELTSLQKEVKETILARVVAERNINNAVLEKNKMKKRIDKFKKRKCGYEKCQKKFKLSKNNPQQEYCSSECWFKNNKK